MAEASQEAEKALETLSRWDVVQLCLERLRDDRTADPGEIREYMANNGLDALRSLRTQLDQARAEAEAATLLEAQRREEIEGWRDTAHDAQEQALAFNGIIARQREEIERLKGVLARISRMDPMEDVFDSEPFEIAREALGGGR